MIRVGLYSREPALESRLSSTLGSKFQFISQPSECGIDRLVAYGNCGVILLDLNSRQNCADAFLDSARRLVRPEAASVVTADDALRPAAAFVFRPVTSRGKAPPA